VGRFIAPDTIVPGAGALTAAPHDATATTAWRSAATTGPQNPQEINRYSYALNNPMRYNDPSGQCVGPVIVYCAGLGAKALFDAATVVIGGYLIYDGMQQIAEDTGAPVALPIAGTGVAGASVGGAGELAGVTNEPVIVNQVKGEYVPPGLKGNNRGAYRTAVHRYKKI
jgi:hypothetical protein